MNSEPIVYAGFQRARVYALNTYGRPAGTGLTAYTGREIYAPKVYTLTLPEPRRIPHVGNDRLLKVQQLPSLEVASGEITVGAEDLDLIALLSGTTVLTVADMKTLPHLSDKQGKEPNVGMILSQAAIAQSGGQRIHWHMISQTTAIPRLSGMSENAGETIYSIAPNPSQYYLWGMPLAVEDIYGVVTTATGATEAGVFSGFSEKEPVIAAFVANGSEDEFPFKTTELAANASDLAVFLADEDEVELVDPSDYTATVNGITFDAPPSSGDEVIVLYQRA